MMHIQSQRHQVKWKKIFLKEIEPTRSNCINMTLSLCHYLGLTNLNSRSELWPAGLDWWCLSKPMKQTVSVSTQLKLYQNFSPD